MIGDNPETDIRGGNRANCITILTRSGIFQGKTNAEKFPANHVVDNFYEAIRLICRLEGIHFAV